MLQKNVDMLAISSSVLYNYFEFNKIIFRHRRFRYRSENNFVKASK